MKKQQLQAIFFDFDGVLIDSTKTKTEAFRILFKDYDENIINKIVAHHQQHGGISRVDKIRYAHDHIIQQPLTEDGLETLGNTYSQLVVEKVITAKWIPGALEFLQNSPSQLPLFVISGTPEEELKHIIDQRNIAHFFTEILGSPTKKPEHILRLLKTHHLLPNQCAFIGDALTDFKAANETGLHFFGIQGEVDFPEGTHVLPDCFSLEEVIEQRFIWQQVG